MMRELLRGHEANIRYDKRLNNIESQALRTYVNINPSLAPEFHECDLIYPFDDNMYGSDEGGATTIVNNLAQLVSLL